MRGPDWARLNTLAMRMFPFKQAGVSGVESKESDSAHTLARSGSRLMTYTPMTQHSTSARPRRTRSLPVQPGYWRSTKCSQLTRQIGNRDLGNSADGIYKSLIAFVQIGRSSHKVKGSRTLSCTWSTRDPRSLAGSLPVRLPASSAVRTDAEAGLDRLAASGIDHLEHQPPVACAGCQRGSASGEARHR